MNKKFRLLGWGLATLCVVLALMLDVEQVQRRGGSRREGGEPRAGEAWGVQWIR
jgi:hypothetical protein